MLREKKNLANLITFSRIIGVIFMLWAMPYKNSFIQAWIIIIFTLTGLTDLLDGWAARKYKLVSDLGKILDPLADKLLILLFLPLLSLKAITAFPVFIILSREFAIMGLRVFAAKKNMIISAGFSGKLKTGLTLPVIGILIARIPAPESQIPFLLKPLHFLMLWIQTWPNWCFQALIWSVVTVTVWSFFDYCYQFMLNIQDKKTTMTTRKKNFLVLIPNAITLLNLSCGILAVLHSFIENYTTAGALILIGTILDALDGSLARKLNVSSKFGAQLDTTTDLITFGVAPGILIYSFLANQNLPYSLLAGCILGMSHIAAIYYRLRRYSGSSGHSQYFEGLPAPGGAAVVVFTAATQIFSPFYPFMAIMIINQLISISKLPYPHNSASKMMIGYSRIRMVTLIFWLIQIAVFLGLPFPSDWPLAELNFALLSIYLAAPIWPKYKNKESHQA
eukprot:COSAG01_NODE_9_length_43729_cov_66.133463_8_plen_449_part_00